MRVHFRNREYLFWTHARGMTPADQQIAADLVHSRILEEALDRLEYRVQADIVSSVACSIVFQADPGPETVMIELQGDARLLKRINWQIGAELPILMPDARHANQNVLLVPLMLAHRGI